MFASLLVEWGAVFKAFLFPNWDVPRILSTLVIVSGRRDDGAGRSSLPGGTAAKRGFSNRPFPSGVWKRAFSR
jgi:hypothetical protein